MPNELNFIVTLSDDQEDRIRVIAFKEKGTITRFVVQYEAYIGDDWKGVVNMIRLMDLPTRILSIPMGTSRNNHSFLLILMRHLHLPCRTSKYPGNGIERPMRRRREEKK